jgi:hypothetical protein
MTSTSRDDDNNDELGRLISGHSKLFLTRPISEYFRNLPLIEIPPIIARELDLKERDYIIWHYYTDAKVAFLRKREITIRR